MELSERLAKAHKEAATLYLRRQQVESQRQQLARVAADLDLALVKSDGAVELLEALLSETPARESEG